MPEEPVVNYESEAQAEVYLPIDHAETAKVIVLGVIAGSIVPLLAMLIANYFIEPVFCRTSEAMAICSSGGVVAYHVAAILTGMMAVALLANWGVFRPLLIVLAVTVVTWGLFKYTSPISQGNLAEFLAFSAALHGIAYFAFYWVLRLKHFAASAALTLAVAGIACWAMVA